jgi:hypothetical protein
MSWFRMKQLQVRFWVIPLVVASTVGGSLPARSPREPIKTLNEPFAAQSMLRTAAGSTAHDSIELTVRFSFTRFGRIFGTLAVTFKGRMRPTVIG